MTRTDQRGNVRRPTGRRLIWKPLTVPPIGRRTSRERSAMKKRKLARLAAATGAKDVTFNAVMMAIDRLKEKASAARQRTVLAHWAKQKPRRKP
jgi:hypothetical protein